MKAFRRFTTLFVLRRALYTVVFDLHYVEKNEINKRVQFWVDCIQTRFG